MTKEQAISRVNKTRFACDGTEADFTNAALGHPRVWLEIDPEEGAVTCGYCDRLYILIGSQFETGHEPA